MQGTGPTCAGVEFVVIDTGIGLRDEDHELVFQSFHQVDGSTTRRHGGNRLGLAIGKELTELMGGSVAVQSQLGAGSTFVVRLPLELHDAGGEVADVAAPFPVGSVNLRAGGAESANAQVARDSVPSVTLNHVRRGSGKPLLLVHGLGAGWRSWAPVVEELADHREVIAVDLPGFGDTPPLTGEVSIATLTDSVADFIREQGLHGVATVGQSMGGRMVLELARRGVGGDTVALAPGGFWSDRELVAFGATLRPSIALVRALRGALPSLLGSPVGRTALLAQFSAHPWALSRETVLPDVLGLADAPATASAMDALTKGPKQEGAPAGTVPGRVTIGWGRRDLVTLPRQASRATELFPDAVLHWFERCGHYPQWDSPREATRLILDSTR